MTPATPFMLEVLRRIQRDANRAQDGYMEAWRYPLQQIKGLEKRGLLVHESPSGKPLKVGEYVRLTDAGRALLEPPVKELDDLVVLDEVTAAWPLEE